MIKQSVFQGLSPASKWKGCFKSNRELWIYEKCRKNGQKSVVLEKSFELVLQTLTRQLMEIEEVLQGRQNAFPENPKKWPKNDKNWEISDNEFNLWLQTVTWESMYKLLFVDLIWRAYWKCEKRSQRKNTIIGKKNSYDQKLQYLALETTISCVQRLFSKISVKKWSQNIKGSQEENVRGASHTNWKIFPSN